VDARIRRSIGPIIVTALLLAAFPRTSSAQRMDQAIGSFALFDILEYSGSADSRPIRWDSDAWIGNQYTKLWIKSEGDIATVGGGGEAEVQALYSRMVTAYFDAQIGGRLDLEFEDGEVSTRAHLAVAMEGLAPYWFEIEPSLFVSQDGDISATFTASYEMLFTQRLILQPRVEASAAVQKVERWGVASGLNTIGLGARFRYELKREFAPYVGVSWTRFTGEAADMARASGRKSSQVTIVLGLRLWK
jgi:copper resistance protein B